MNSTDFLKQAFYKSDLESIQNLMDYLGRLGGKTLKEKCIADNLFKTTWKIKELDLRARCHVQAANNYIKHLFSHYKIFKKSEINTVIADLVEYVEYLDENEKIDFILISPNITPTRSHFRNVKNLFYEHQILESQKGNFDTDLLVTYGLRLSLEKRIRGLLGIDIATVKSKPVGLSSLIDVAKKLKNVNYSQDIRWDEIKKLNNWINHYIHRNIRPYTWTIHEAIQILEPLMNPKKPIIENGNKRYSANASTYVINEEELKNEIESLLKSKFPEVKVQWLPEREILIKK